MTPGKPVPASGRARARRTLLMLAATGCLALPAHPPSAAEALTEQDAVRRALARPAFQDVLQGSVDAAQADATESGLWPNPSLDYERERTGSAGGDVTEQKAHLSQAFDVGGKRALRREAAERRLDAARQDGVASRVALAAEVRHAFHDVLFVTRRIAVLRDWQDTLARAEDTLSRLQRGGEVSGYDRRRIARERLAAQAKLADAQAEAERAGERLRALTATPTDLAPAGDLLPAEPPPLETLLAQVTARGDLQALAARAQAFGAERKAADRAWIPDVTLGAGVKRVEEPGRSDSGVLLSVAVPIPLFERGQAAVQRASAQARALQGEHLLALARAEGEVRGVWRQARALRAAAVQFLDASLPASHELARIAEAAYRGGETGILELLDAYRSRLDAETEALELETKARRARIELDALIGADPQ